MCYNCFLSGWIKIFSWSFNIILSKINRINRKVEGYSRPEKHYEPIQHKIYAMFIQQQDTNSIPVPIDYKPGGDSSVSWQWPHVIKLHRLYLCMQMNTCKDWWNLTKVCILINCVVSFPLLILYYSYYDVTNEKGWRTSLYSFWVCNYWKRFPKGKILIQW